jgi:hypothetical protein
MQTFIQTFTGSIVSGYLTVSFVAGMVVGMVVFWRALGDKGLE